MKKFFLALLLLFTFIAPHFHGHSWWRDVAAIFIQRLIMPTCKRKGWDLRPMKFTALTIQASRMHGTVWADAPANCISEGLLLTITIAVLVRFKHTVLLIMTIWKTVSGQNQKMKNCLPWFVCPFSCQDRRCYLTGIGQPDNRHDWTTEKPKNSGCNLKDNKELQPVVIIPQASEFLEVTNITFLFMKNTGCQMVGAPPSAIENSVEKQITGCGRGIQAIFRIQGLYVTDGKPSKVIQKITYL